MEETEYGSNYALNPVKEGFCRLKKCNRGEKKTSSLFFLRLDRPNDQTKANIK
jgi:hypothetical protein